MEIEKNLNTEKRFRATNPGSKPVFPLKQGEVDLFNLNLSASFLKGCLESLSVCFGNFLFKSCRSTVNEILSFLKTKSEFALDNLDYIEFALTC